jgi:Domain of unknown function (DUF6089)
MNKLTQLRLTALLLCSSFYSLHAQKWSCAAQVGTTAYLGDVSEHLAWRPNQQRAVGGASVAYNALDFLTIRLNVVAGQLSGYDAENTSTTWRKQRAFRFQTPFIETSVLTEFDVFKAISNDRYSDKTNLFSVHVLVGAGVNRINPMVDFNEPNPISELVGLDKNAVYNHNQVVIPYGLVFKWHINESSAIRLEGMVRKTFSDYFDGVSKSAASKNNDVYMTATIGWEQTLSWGLRGWERRRFTEGGVYCPKFR